MSNEHPKADILTAFLHGRLPDRLQEKLVAHISECGQCCQQLRTVREDRLGKLIRASESARRVSLSVSDTTPEPFYQVSLPRTGILPEFANHPRYRVLEVIGEGGMGVVYKAMHRLMERTVALKVIRANYTNNAVAVERFRREVKAAARLDHPNIVHAYDAEQAGGLHFLVMEFVDGESLDKLVKRLGSLPVKHACSYIAQVATGLCHAHEQGMVHRDIKPHNLIVTRNGRVKILDFGLARLADNDQQTDKRQASLTLVDTVVGTPDYLSPEQAVSSRSVDIRSDIYSLGCTFYQLLTGQSPFPDRTVMEKLIDHCKSEPVPVEQLCPDVPAEVAAVVRKMMAKNPQVRYQSPAELVQDLSPLCRELQQTPNQPSKTTVPPITPNPEAKPSSRRSWLIPFGLFFVGIVVLGMACLPGWFSPPDEKTVSDDNSVAVVSPKKMQKVLFVLSANELNEEDYLPVAKIMKKKGITFDVASSADAIYIDGMPVDIRVDKVLDGSVQADSYSAVVFFGAGVDEFIDKKSKATINVCKLLETMVREEKVVAGICSGQLILLEHDALNGRRICKEGPESFGKGITRDPTRDVVRDGNIITASGPEQANEFAQEILKALKQRKG